MIKVFLALGAIQFLTMLVQLVKTKTLAIILGPELFGVMAVVDKLVAVAVQTASFSLPFAASVFLPALWLRDREAFQRLLRRMTRVLVGAASLAGLGGAVLTLLDPTIWGEGLEAHRWTICFGFLGAPALALAPFIQNVIAGRLEERKAMGFTLLHALVVSVCAVVGVLWAGLQGYYALYAVAGLALAIGGLTFVFRSSARSEIEPGREAPSGPDRALKGGSVLPPGIWRFSLPMMGLTFAAPFAALYVHYSVLDGLGAATAGWMQAAIGISLAVRGVLGAAHGVFLTPNVNRGESPERAMEWANVYGRTTVLLSAALVPPLLLFAGVAVEVLYSSTFLPGSQFVTVFVAVEVIGLVVSVYSALPIAFDHMAFHVTYSGIGQGLMVAAAVLLIPMYGVFGAGVAMLVPHVVTFFAVGGFLRWKYGLRPPRATLVLLGTTLAWMVLAGWLGQAFPSLSPDEIAIKAAAYGASLIVLGMLLTDDERDRLRGLRFLR